MEERKLGPVVGLGTFATFEDDEALAREVVDAAFGAGVRVFDSSPMYGAAERSLGAALDGHRSEATLATKVWAPSVREGRGQYEAQLRFFGRVDVEQVHNLVSWEEQLRWLGEEKAEGRINHIGVTHWSSASFGELEQALHTGRFDVVQLPLNLGEREAERRLLPLAMELGVAVIVMRPFGGTGAPLLQRAPDPAGPRAAPDLRDRDLGSGTPQVGAVGLASRRRDTRDVPSGARGRERCCRRAALVRPGRARLRRALGAAP